MPEYTVLTVIAVLGTVAIELCWLRTGIFATLQYWLTMAIVFGFQIPVDGWLTKLNDPIVIYARSQMLGIRMPWDIPIEDFGFGFAMVTLTILAWRRLLDRPRRQDHSERVKRSAGAERSSSTATRFSSPRGGRRQRHERIAQRTDKSASPSRGQS